MSQSGRPFRLLDFFKLTSLVAFAAAAVVLYSLERAEFVFFDDMQQREEASFAVAQADLLSAQKAGARSSLLMEHEAGHLALTTVIGNALWDAHFAPLVAQAQHMPKVPGIGRRIRALAGFEATNDAVHAMMKGSTVFKVKVYDLRGLTVYSSELAQVGEDKASNQGWRVAASGRPASEIVHRERFSAFEGEVEDRDLIQSYVPVRRRAGEVVGVFEIYSDVTALLRHLEASSEHATSLAADNLAKTREASRASRREAETNSNLHFVVVFALLAALYAVQYLLVRRGQAIIDQQAGAREAAALREQHWHGEKMAALAAMAANASHEIGNPLAIITGLAEDIERAVESGEPVNRHAEGILEQTWRIAEMTRRITDFASARSETSEPVDANEFLQAVRHFLSFDTRYRMTWVEEDLQPRLPLCNAIPDHLNEVLMNLLQAYSEASLKAGALVKVHTSSRGGEVTIRIGCHGTDTGGPCDIAATDARIDAARARIEAMGGRFEVTATATEIHLPCHGSQVEEDAPQDLADTPV
ncbi:MAG: HAMP domain-containing histidine kinase [Burkholderiales bacterium]|nr:HAMP domain-containing histidine kinase [Burkholderiales bacterium]